MFLKYFNFAILFSYVSILVEVTYCAEAENKFLVKVTYCAEAENKSAVAIPQRRKFQPKIFFGADSTIDQYPSFIGLFLKDHYGTTEFECGGAIITKRMVLSAAHCVYFFPEPDRYTIKTGSSFRIGEGGTLYHVKKITIHNKFKFMTLDYDFAILKTRQEIVFSNLVQSVSYIEHTVPDNAPLTVVGWGQTETGNLAEQLKKTIIYKMDKEKCKRALLQFTLTKAMFCAKDRDREKRSDTCMGDSGGPIYYNNQLAGLTSWAPESACAKGQTTPAVYADLLSVSDWLQSQIA